MNETSLRLIIMKLFSSLGTYPQLKRSSLSNIPIYENIDGYPVPIHHPGAGVPEPPPYTGAHNIVVSDTLTKSNSR
jgi:hypothetical protein